MKFCVTTLKTKLLCITGLLLLTQLTGSAQKTSVSPYSRYGLGTEREGKFLRNYGLAGAGYALTSPRHINPVNPASYYSIQDASFEAALEGTNVWMEGNGQKQFQNKTYFSHLLFGMPVTKWWGLGFGMLPMTKVGYEYQVTTSLNEEVGRVTNLFEGSGGLNRIMVGNGFKLTDKLAAGFNASYLLGNLTYKERIIFVDQGSTFSTRKTDEYGFSDFYFDFGLQYRFQLKESLFLTAGLTYAYADQVNAKRTLLVESYSGNIGFERIKDTVESAIDRKTHVDLPNFYGLGFALEKENKWLLTLDVDYSDWSTVDFNATEPYSDAYAVKAGYEYYSGDTKKGRIRDNELSYRLGARYASSYITLGGDPLQEVAFSAGLSFYRLSKLGSQRTTRGLNFGMEVGRRGEDSDTQFRETFVNLIFGITINDRWFIKRKYD